MRATRDTFMKLKSFRSAMLSAAAFTIVVAVMAGCGELTGPESPSTPTDVVATLVSTSSATVTWTPSPLNDGVISYTIYRNGNEVGESTTTSFTDTGLAQQTTYVYSVAANCKGGVISDRSAETAQSTITTVDITPPSVASTVPANGASNVSRAGTVTVTFSEPMDPATINSSTFNIRVKSSGTILPGTVTYNATTRVAELVPTGALPNLTTIVVTVTTGAKDLAGNPLAAPFTAEWTTRDEEGPTVTPNSPVNGALGVSPNATITVTFSEAVDATTVTSANLVLKVTSSGATVPGTVTYNPTTRVATFTPTSALSQNVNYTFTVSGVKDPQGNTMPAPFTLTFTVDTTPPTATILPAGGASNIPTNSSVLVTFSEAMDASTINSTNITLKNTATSAIVPTTVTYNATTRVATITPTGPLSNGTNYTVTVTTAVKDAGGNPLAAPVVSTFTTSGVGDAIAPTIVAKSPAPGTTNVSRSTAVTVTFSEAMDPSTINSTNIRLAPASALGSPVAATVTYTGVVATLTPTAILASNTNYTVIVTTGVKDLVGNQLAAQEMWTFTTSSDVIAPTIVSTSPVNGTTVPVPGTVTVTFSEDMDPTSLNGTLTNFTVKTTAGLVTVPGVVSYNVATKTAIFTPTAPFAANTNYTVTVTSGAKDLAGNGLAVNSTFTFQTNP